MFFVYKKKTSNQTLARNNYFNILISHLCDRMDRNSALDKLALKSKKTYRRVRLGGAIEPEFNMNQKSLISGWCCVANDEKNTDCMKQ